MTKHDTLTNLPNRRLFNQVAEFFLKRVNDNAGDELLQQVTEHLQKSIRRDDLIARHGGVEFLIQITNDCHINKVKKIASEIINQLTQLFSLTKGQAFIDASIGISVSLKTVTN
jgi:diguanylate cyclase (GGDEF)-like protein